MGSESEDEVAEKLLVEINGEQMTSVWLRLGKSFCKQEGAESTPLTMVTDLICHNIFSTT